MTATTHDSETRFSRRLYISIDYHYHLLLPLLLPFIHSSTVTIDHKTFKYYNMDISILPPEIIVCVLEHLPLADLVRAERTCRMIQAFCHSEINRRIISGPLKDDWGVLVHLDQATATATHFDTRTKKVTFTISMPRPVQIKTMFDHRRQVQCSLLRRNQYCEDFVFTVEKGIIEGSTVDISAEGAALCEINAAVTRHEKLINNNNKKFVPPSPHLYSLQLTQLQIPLSTIAAQ
ncbi:hypothetical protein BDA99DRAFT_510569 [Phascolomyces articulosus]|uniref:F-box domain-containing protein n=1 Tax=Phascolomyces articulosus TaxID=60185 RepID=A0AAD5PDY1_9FUNG|nr:hypothetical protein BDA99DRAFT_510569 [Phascolomyces articulosus]